jgi:regulatory protein YycI of two-component signal transduction system YycFG
MDWGRTKTILILSFLCLNLFFGYQLYQIRSENQSLSAGTIQDSYSIEKLLELNNIRLIEAIPDETPKLRDVLVKYEVSPFRQFFDKPLKSNAVFERKSLSDLLTEQIPSASNYELDQAISTNSHYVLNQLYNGIPLFNVQLDLYAVNGKISEFIQSKVSISESDKNPQMQVMSAKRALQFLIENYLEKGAVIKSIQLGYHGQEFETNVQLLSPNWRFVLNGGTIYYVHAINGEVEVVEKEQ